MNSDIILYSFHNQNYSIPKTAEFNYSTPQSESFQNISSTHYINEEYPVTNYTKTNNYIQDNNNYAQTYENFNETIPNTITQENNISSQNIPAQYENLISNDFNTNSNTNQINALENHDIRNNNNNDIITSEIPQPSINIDNNLNPINNELNTNLNNLNIENTAGNINNNINIPNSMNNQIKPINNIVLSNVPNPEFHTQQLNINNNENEEFPSFKPFKSVMTVKSQILDSNKNLEKNETKKSRVSSPKLVDPLETKIPPSPPSVHSMQSIHEEIKEKKEEEPEQKLNLTKDEQILLKKEEPKKKYNIKSHFDLTLTKDENKFFYNKVHKIATPLLAHYEMPDNLEYKSPILSPNGKYIACIGKGTEDSVFVWEVSDLYWYKYKFSYSTVDCIALTPNSKSLIIVYSNSNPIMYDLSTGKVQLEFENNGEENNCEKYKCSFTNKDTHFALTTSTSYTLWSLRTGKIKQQILDESPIKIASNDHLIFIDANLNCTIKKITDQSIIEQFGIKGVESLEEILDARCTRDMANLIYVIKHGIIVYNFKKKEFNGLQKFECGVEKATLSPDGKYILKTNMKDFVIYDLEKGVCVCTILKDKFKEYNIDYTLKKILIIDNISIIIKDFTDEKSVEKNIWLNKNPTKFSDVKFSNDFKILLARVNRNAAVVYDVNSGYIIKKWENLDENWLDYCITTFGGDKIAVKTNLLLIKVWNFNTGKEEATFHGFNSHSLAFNSDGDYLICGTKNGSEIARVWSIPEQKYGIFKYNGNNNNYHTKVHLTYPVPKRMICCSVDQPPLIFNAYTKELLKKCECAYRFEEIYEIQS